MADRDQGGLQTRRHVLKLMAGMSLGVGLAGCSVVSNGGGAPQSGGSPRKIRIPKTGAKLPRGEASFKWLDSDDSKADFFKEFFPAYRKAHPNINAQYQGLPGPQIAQIVPLGVQNHNAPDVFQVPPGIPGYTMISDGWVRPLDDIIPDLAAWKRRFPPGVLVEGQTMFNGKVYACPYLSNRQYPNLCLFNKDYMRRAGYDPATKPLTWETFRAAARKVTQQGKGQYYGLIFPGQVTTRWSGVVSGLAEMANGFGSGIDWHTGQYNFTSSALLGAIDLLQAMKSDGSFFPGSLDLDAPKAESRMPAGAAGIILQGPWNIPLWKRGSPQFGFGVGSQPIPSSGHVLPMHFGPGAFIPPWLYAQSKYPQIAGDIFSYLTSEDGQRAFAALTQGFPPPILPHVGRNADLDPRVLQAYDLFDKQLRLGPDPAVRNPDVSKVLLEMKPPHPDLGQIVQGLFTGQISDARKSLEDLEQRSESALDDAIKKAQAKGAKVSREDWKFPNWNPTEDYTDADYRQLSP